MFGAAQLQRGLPARAPVPTALDSAFLLVYGLLSLWRARRPGAPLLATQTEPARRAAVLAQAAAFTFLNPHVYLDTVQIPVLLNTQSSDVITRSAAHANSAHWGQLLGADSRKAGTD